jgi:hypothetical protein
MAGENAARTAETEGQNAARTAETEGQNAERTSDSGQQEAVREAGRRERSSIGFPYNPLDDAIEVARAIHDHVGVGECDDTQLSVWLDQSSKSSGYRMHLTAARMFGVLDPTSDTRKLTALGRMIVDPRQERTARADAFLKVPLYSAIYEKHRDSVLPPPDALETEIVGLGVAEKQKGRARQVFERSAQQAGYSEHGKNRLVRPGVAPLEKRDPNEEHKKGGGGGGGDEPPRHPLMEGLFQSLPPDGERWTVEEAADWLQAAAYNLRFAYKFQGRIKVTVEGQGDIPIRGGGDAS